ncbi:CGNR zinc finger domain-containing protein [Stenotrophomonas chelatiphaga]|uniref:CGNR zinc finger domain-containing protein n=1 Tax=Stenotrophomonas chelatiphaga TaxID=517011 RepID=UPI003D0B5364
MGLPDIGTAGSCGPAGAAAAPSDTAAAIMAATTAFIFAIPCPPVADGPSLDRFRPRGEHPLKDLLLVDPTPSRRRRWCSMAACESA